MAETPEQLRRKLENLASLLDDSDDAIAGKAIASLLEYEDDLGDLPSRLQEDPDPLVRKRAHQLQAAMHFRYHRRMFHRLLQEDEPDFRTGMALLHLLWFDKDNQVDVYGAIDEFIAEIRRREFSTLGEIGFYLRKLGFHAVPETPSRPESFCAGMVLEDCCGADSLLAGMVAAFIDLPGLSVVRCNGKFGLYCGASEVLYALDGWRLSPAPAQEQMEFWDSRMILRFCGSMLFSAAVYSDSFRYILTIAQALSGDRGDGIMKELPYPYGSSR